MKNRIENCCHQPRRAFALAFLCAALMLAMHLFAPVALAQGSPPSNDAFPGESITGATGSVRGTNVDATEEVGENDPYTEGANLDSVWWSWTAPADGPVCIDTLGSDFNTLLAVYMGDAFPLTEVDGVVDNSYCGSQSGAFFHATANTVYRIQVDGNGSSMGQIALNWQLLDPADPLNQWDRMVGSPNGEHRAVAFGTGTAGDLFVAVGLSSLIQTSPDGITWTTRTSAIANSAHHGVTFGNGLFVAVGRDFSTGAPAIETSPDGITWTARTSAIANAEHVGVAFDAVGGLFVAVGDDFGAAAPAIETSPDGITWTARTSAIAIGEHLGVTFANGVFVAVGDDFGAAAPAIETSPDGITWTARTSAIANGVHRGVTFGNGVFVAVGDNFGAAAPAIETSPDGITWTARTSAIANGRHFGVTFANGVFVAVGEDFTGSPDPPGIETSPDGITWTQRASNFIDGQYYGVAFGNGVFVAVGDDDDSGPPAIETSPDGTVWTRVELLGNLNGTTFGNGQFVTVGSRGAILTSPDGMTWTLQDSGVTITLDGVAYGNGQYVVVGSSDTVLTSPDGVTWTPQLAGDDSFDAVTYGGGRFVAVGGSVAASSPDGINWTVITLGDEDWNSIVYGGGLFVAVGDYGQIATSPDGLGWTFTNGAYSGEDLHSVAFGGGRFVAVGDCGQFLTSVDGMTWSNSGLASECDLDAVTYDGSCFVAFGEDGTVISSVNGTSWEKQLLAPDFFTPGVNVNAATSARLSDGNTYVVAVGNAGVRLRSGALIGGGDVFDLNKDGCTDLIFAGPGGDVIFLYLKGTTAFTSSDTALFSSSLGGYEVVATGDMNKDGCTDVIVQGPAGDVLFIYLKGSPAFTSSDVATLTSSTGGYTVVGAADLNKDGCTDLIFQGPGDDVVFLYLKGSTSFTSSDVATLTSSTGGYAVSGTGDMNKDGCTDLVFQGPGGDVVFLHLKGSTAFTESDVAVLTSSTGGYTVKGAADLNKDGCADLIFAGPGGDVVFLYLKGTTEFTLPGDAEVLTPTTGGYEVVAP